MSLTANEIAYEFLPTANQEIMAIDTILGEL